MLRLKKKKPALKPAAYKHQVGLLEMRLEKLAGQNWKDADADRLTARLRKYRHKLTTFLHKDGVEGTNNAAERALRAGGGDAKNHRWQPKRCGRWAWAIVASVMRTAEQQGRDVLETLKTLLRAAWSGKDIGLLTDTS